MQLSDLMPISIPRFIVGSNEPEPGSPQEHQWVVHCHSPRYIARVGIAKDTGRIQLTPVFDQPPESFDPKVVQDALQAGAAHYARIVNRAVLAHQVQSRP